MCHSDCVTCRHLKAQTMATSPQRAVSRPRRGASGEQTLVGRVVKLLGGPLLLRESISSQLDAHEAIVKGIPGGALVYMVKHVKGIKPADVTRAVGVSLRTVQRRMKAPTVRLNQEQSGRTWKFAEVLAKATQVFGDQGEAEKWLAQPAMALDERRPIDLLASPAGSEMVEQLLGRLEHGIYT